MNQATTEAPSVPQEPACHVCQGVEVVRYSRASLERPAPFCGTCHRPLDLVLVDDEPWTQRKNQGAQPMRTPDAR